VAVVGPDLVDSCCRTPRRTPHRRDVVNMTEAEMLSLHEIYRAEVLISRFRGSDAHESVAALVHYAEAQEMSVHAAALAVLARGPTADDPLEHACV